MYPMSAVVVGCSDALLPHVRRELLNRSVELEAEIPAAEVFSSRLYSWQGKPRLFLVHIKGTEDREILHRLSGILPSQPILALLDNVTDPEHLIRAMRAGASQVVPSPFAPDDFQAALDVIATQFGAPRYSNRLIAVSGVSGGCGATTLAINLAYEMAFLQPKTRCLLVELSLQMGRLATYLNVEPRYTTSDLLRDMNRLDAQMLKTALTKITDNFSILAGPYRTISPQTVSPADLSHFIDHSRDLADIVVLDVPSNHDGHYFDILSAADQIVLVGEQKVPHIRALQMVQETLASKMPVLVINRYNPRARGFDIRQLEKFLGAERLLTIANDSKTVLRAVNNGRPLRLQSTWSPALADIDRLVHKLLDIPEHSRNGNGSSVFGKLLRAVGL